MNSLIMLALILLTFGQAPARLNDVSPHREQFVRANGIKVHYLDWGGTGEPMLLLTGFGETAHMFDKFAERFRNRFHVYSFTRRGQAPSERSPSGYDIATLTADIRAFMDVIGLRRAHLVGASIAGTEMTEFAAAYPNRVSSLVYLDAAFDLAAREAVFKIAPFPAAPQPPPGSILAQMSRWSTSYSPNYKPLKAPALAFYAITDPTTPIPRDATADIRQRTEFYRSTFLPMIRRMAEGFQRDAPNGRAIMLNSSHFIYRDRENDVVREMERFYASIK